MNLSGIARPAVCEWNESAYQALQAIKCLQDRAHATAVAKGWYEQPKPFDTMVANVHKEVSEMFDADVAGNPPDKHIPEFRSVEVEAADVIIRLFDSAAYYGWNLGPAILAKMDFNDTRPIRHGGKSR